MTEAGEVVDIDDPSASRIVRVWNRAPRPLLLTPSPWVYKVQEVAGFDPARVREIRRTCTRSEIAAAWVAMKAATDAAWHDVD